MKQTSRVFDTWLALYELLDQQEWPSHPTTGEAPRVVFGDDAPSSFTNEMIVVVGTPSGTPDSDWATGSGPSQDEEFTLQVVVGTKIPGQTRAEVFARIAELCDIVQTSMRDQTTGKPAGGFSASAGEPGPLWWRVSPPRPQLYATPEGFAAYADLFIKFNARI